MPYTTVEKVRGLSKLTDEEDMVSQDIETHIKTGQARIDTVLRKRYAVPFLDPVPDLVEAINVNFAAGFAIEKHYSNRPDKTEPYLAEVLIKRAEAWLQEILAEGSLDGLPGVVMAPVKPSAIATPAVRTTTPQVSEMEQVLSRWV